VRLFLTHRPRRIPRKRVTATGSVEVREYIVRILNSIQTRLAEMLSHCTTTALSASYSIVGTSGREKNVVDRVFLGLMNRGDAKIIAVTRSRVHNMFFQWSVSKESLGIGRRIENVEKNGQRQPSFSFNTRQRKISLG